MALTKCIECGWEIAQTAVACPNCGAPGPESTPQRISTDAIKEPGKLGNAYKWAVKHPFKTFLIFVVIIWLIGSMTHTKQHRVITASNQATSTKSGFYLNIPAEQISAEQLHAEYEANVIAADQKYKDKMLEVYGTVESIDKNYLFDTESITLGSGSSHYLVKCLFPKKHESQLLNLSKGQLVYVKGRCGGGKFLLFLKECTL